MVTIVTRTDVKITLRIDPQRAAHCRGALSCEAAWLAAADPNLLAREATAVADKQSDPRQEITPATPSHRRF